MTKLVNISIIIQEFGLVAQLVYTVNYLSNLHVLDLPDFEWTISSDGQSVTLTL